MMNPPAATIWLDAWERGMSVSPVRRPAVLLETYYGEESQPERWPLGRREAALLEVRAALFGGDLESVASCPACGGVAEFTLQADAVLAAAPQTAAGLIEVESAGIRATFRLPNTLDLEAAMGVAAGERRKLLLSRCLSEECGRGEWPEEFVGAAAGKMAEADPLGDVSLTLGCPDCREIWEAPFDAATYLWSELNAWAGRMMAEIHLLAAGYGWTEPEILELPPHRRRFYIGSLQRS